MTTDTRFNALCDWLHSILPDTVFTIGNASADASFRRYFRLSFLDGRSLIAMDCPPDKEDVRPFIHVADVLKNTGVLVPEIIAQNVQSGFLLLTDLGQQTFLDILQHTTDLSLVDRLYTQALDALLTIQSASAPGIFPDYDEAMCRRDLALFPQWYLKRHLNIELTESEHNALSGLFDDITARVLSQPRVFVHRDYIVRNLMVGDVEPGIIDFQDAVYGPITYDAVSLLEDAFISWDEELTLDWLIKYWEKARKKGLPVGDDIARFHNDYEWMGLQRHLKVLGIFCRLAYRDNKPKYLAELPRFSGYVRRTCERYRVLSPLLRILDRAEGYNEKIVYSF